MKAYTSRDLFDERARDTGVREQMGQVRLDAEANLQADITRTDARRRSADVAEGSPDDGFRITDTHLLDPISSLDGWSAVGLEADDERVITPQLRLVRRDPDTLPHVLRTRGHTAVLRRMPAVDLLRLPVPLHPDHASYAVSAIVLQVRFDRPPTDDEVVDVRAVVFDADGAEIDAGAVPAPEPPDAVQDTLAWTTVSVPIAALAALRRGAGADETLQLAGWGLRGLPPRATVDIDALLVADAGLGESDLVIRGGDGTVTGAGRLFVHGLRTFIEQDWRYSLQPDLPDPEPLERPTPAPDGSLDHHVIYADLFEEVYRGFQDPRLIEPALGGEETSFRTRKMTQIRAVRVSPGASERLLSPTGDGRLTTNVPVGTLPDRFPPEEHDPCRDRCLSTVNVTTGQGYRGSDNVQVRVEVLLAPDAGQPGVIGWSRDNAARVAPLVVDGAAGAQVVFVAPPDARSFAAGDIVVVEDRSSRLDPARAAHRCVVRALRAVNSATGELEFEAAGWTLTTDPVPLVLGGGLTRGFQRADAAAVRRWDGADHLLVGVRYNLVDGIDFALAGQDFRELEHWTFTARVTGPDSVAEGVVEQLTDAPVAGPRHERVPLARLTWTPTGRRFEDLRVQYLPLHEVRQRLIELGARKFAPGAFTVVIGDGRRTFGDIDQDLAEGVTGDEALQAALDRLGAAGGAIYVRAGDYRLEHPVLLQNRSRVRILGDGAASRLTVTGAGGAFHIDACGAAGELSIELLSLAETPELETPIGTEAARPVVRRPFGPIEPIPRLVAERPLVLADLQSSVPTAPDLLAGLATRLREAGPFGGRAASSVVATLAQLRRLQRADPGRPLEDVAPAELDVLRRLPHGVVTISDSSRVRLADLELTSREQGQAQGTVAAAVLVTGSCSDVVVDSCRLLAPSGVVATALARSFTAAAIALWPVSGLFLHGLSVRDCVLDASGAASHGVRVADGIIDGVKVTDTRITGFATGISIEDTAESRTGEAIDRTLVRGNVVVGSAGAAVRITGDGVEVVGNEIRLTGGRGPVGAGVRAGIQITGASDIVRDNWIELDPRTAPALSVQAGVVIGTGADDGRLVGRPVQDVTVTGNRIDGVGAQAIGVLVGGATPHLTVRITDNVLRALGDAGVRVWASSGPVGEVTIAGNVITDVAREYLSWGPSVVAEVQALTGAQLPVDATPRDVLDLLLARPAGELAATDAVLRWLERATLRGGIVLSLAEDSEVRDNRIREVGRTNRPAGFVGPGTDVRTAGVVAVGTRDLQVAGNEVRGVRTPVVVVRPPVVPVGPIRPPVLDLLPGLIRPSAAGRIRDVFAPAVALRRQAMEYSAGDARIRQRIGRSIYAAIESLAGALDAGGPQSRRLAVDLQGGLTEMLEAQGTDGHTQAAHRVRATLSRAAALTAPDPQVAQAWDATARFDAALAGADPSEATQVAATDTLEAAPDLVAGLEGLELDVEGRARVVLGGGSPAERAAAVAALADTLGTLAEARGRKVQIEQSAGAITLSTTDRAAAEGLVSLSLAALEVPDPARLNEAAVATLAQGAAGLTEVLRTSSTPLADRVATDIARLRAAGGRPGAEDIARLTGTLREVQAFARGDQLVHEVRAADLAAQQATFHNALIAVTADQLERRVAALNVDPEASASRNLSLIEQSAAQLAQLVGSDPDARTTARAARAALAEAVADVDHRAEHQARARTLLTQLAGSSGLGATPTPAGSSPAEGESPIVQTDLTKPLAGLAELVLAVGDAGQPTSVRQEAGALLAGQLRSVVDGAGLVAGERTEILDDVATVVHAAIGGGTAERAAALHSLAAKVESVAYRVAQRSDALPEAQAVHVLAGALTRGLDPAVGEADRTAAVVAWTAGREHLLSTSLAGRLRAADGLNATLAGVRGGLDSILGIPLRELGLRPTLAIDAETADGAWLAGAGRSLSVQGNTVADCRTGLTVRGADAHPLAPGGDDESLVLTVAGNVIEGAALGAIDVAVPSATVAVLGNAATGCSGAVDTTPPAYGQAVVAISGSGTLLVADNRLRDNGNTRSEVPIHEVLLDWDGDVTIRGNQVRHAGSTTGGHGVAVISGPVSADLVRQLVTVPPLVAEPATTTGPVIKAPVGVLTGLDRVLAAGLGTALDGDSAGTAAGIGIGGLQLTTRVNRPSFSVLQAATRPVPATMLAQSAADGWLTAAALAPVAVRNPLLEWLRTRRPPLVILPAPVRRSVQVVGNDVIAAGPALVLLHEGVGLVSATVVDNELESLGPVGAVYLRGVDTTVVSANRLESRREVNVVVLRVRASLVSVSGNTAAGREPVTPAAPPVPPTIRPLGPKLGDLHLTVPVGDRGALTLRLDPSALRSAIDTKRSAAYTELADEAQTSFGLFQRASDLTLDPDVAAVLSAGAVSGLNLRTVANRIIAEPALRFTRAAGLADRIAGTGAAVDRPEDTDDAAHPDGTDDGAAGDEAVVAPTAAVAADPRVAKAVLTSNAILASKQLSAPAKLFGLALSSGLPAHQARALVQSNLVRAGGDQASALASGLAEITGIADIAGPTVSDRILDANPVEDLISLLLRNRAVTPVRPDLIRPVRPVPPDPRRHSIVVLGGSRVGVVGNVTTAGVHVHDAAHSVENNV